MYLPVAISATGGHVRSWESHYTRLCTHRTDLKFGVPAGAEEQDNGSAIVTLATHRDPNSIHAYILVPSPLQQSLTQTYSAALVWKIACWRLSPVTNFRQRTGIVTSVRSGECRPHHSRLVNVVIGEAYQEGFWHLIPTGNQVTALHWGGYKVCVAIAYLS